MMKQKFYVLLLGALLACAFPACTKAELEDRPTPEEPDKPAPAPDPDPDVTTGYVTLTPDWGSIAPCAGMRFYFYPASGEVVTKDCPATGFSGDLEAGTYKVLAVNTDASGINFTDMASYATAAATLSAPAGRAAAWEVSVLSLPELVVEKGGTVTRSVAVRALAKNISLSFVFSDVLGVQSLAGSLPGGYNAVLLTTDEPTAAAKAAAPDTYTAFSASLSGNTGSAVVRLSGMLNPANGSAYTNRLDLELTTADGKQHPLAIDLTAALTEVMDANGGTLPAEVEFVIGLDNTFVPVVTVGDWIPSDNTGVIL